MKFDFDDLKKLKQETPAEPDYGPNEVVTAIVRVCEAGYVPEGVHVRSRIDGEMFTAEFTAGRLKGLRADKKVTAVEVNRRLEKIE
ncbi:MAG: hypothetical protein HYX27_24595 [Acidobacteria bacterium]|nr:hypothetical protein [Acidobacteriota bacterium]